MPRAKQPKTVIVAHNGHRITAASQQFVYRMAESAGTAGVTSRELREYPGLGPGAHHGSVSGALSTLHKAGVLAQLEAERDGYHIYVLPEYVGDRRTRARAKISAHCPGCTCPDRTVDPDKQPGWDELDLDEFFDGGDLDG